MTLQPHQKKVKKKIEKENKQLLYHGLGSGKTLSALASRTGKTTVVTPASLRTNIDDTLKKFKLPKTGIKVYSYEGASKAKPKGDTLIVDEAHRLGTSRSIRSQAIRDIAPGYKRVILLTGSPVKNKPHEIAPLADVLGIGHDKIPLDEKSFNKKYIKKTPDVIGIFDRIMGRKPGYILSIKNKDALKKAFSGKVDYFQPSQKDYPSTLSKTHKIQMSKDQEEKYDTMVHRADQNVIYKINTDRPMTAEEKTLANSFLSSARMLSNTGAPFGGEKSTPKTKAIIKNVLKDKTHKNVVYSSFLDGGINIISEGLRKGKVKHNLFHGGMSDKQKKTAVDEYNSGKVKTLLISGAGAEGIDLKGTRGMHIMEPHWNEARIDQVIGRGVRFKSHAHLPKKDQNVTVHRYLSTLSSQNKEKDKRGWFKKLFNIAPPKGRIGADQYMTNMAADKQKLNDEFLRILQ